MLILFKGIETLLTMSGARQKKGRAIKDPDLSIVKQAAILVKRDAIGSSEIIWVGEADEITKSIPAHLLSQIKEEVDLKAKTVMPGFVESHTHSVFSGHRADEFELRNRGVSYLEIAKAGGGILKTMKATRESPLEYLKDQFQIRAKNFIRQGVTTLEVKSGYALNKDDELKMLKSISCDGVQLVRTYLGAHSLPPEYKVQRDYLDFMMAEVLPAIRRDGLAERVDIFIENGFFSDQEARRFLLQAKKMGFSVVIHADQISLCGGAKLAVELGAQSADHLIQIKNPEIELLATSEVTCGLLPAADLYLKCAYPPARELIDKGARVALSTDFNPGSSPTQDIQLVGLLARLEMKMTLPEVLSAYTVGGAYALGLENKIGVIEGGFYADFISTDADWQELFYSVGAKIINRVYKNGALSC